MSFKAWVRGWLGDDGNASASASKLPWTASNLQVKGGDEEIAAGLNFSTAIDAHVQWKVRLKAIIDGRSDEEITVEKISRDDCCVLGIWIYGEGERQFGDQLLFRDLRATHAHFHVCAGHVLQMAQDGHRQQAMTNLMGGEYARTSTKIVNNLAKLYLHLSGHKKAA